MNSPLQKTEKLDYGRPLKIYFSNFWSGIGDSDFFSFVLERTLTHGFTTVFDAASSDLCFSSVFGGEKTDANRTICFIGENRRPDLRAARFSLSFETDSWNGRNFYLPLWMLYVRWPGMDFLPRPVVHHHGTDAPVPVSELVARRNIDGNRRKQKFCAMICSNPETLRLNLFNELSRYKPVDGYGPAFGGAVLLPKSEILKDYKFCLCPENSYYPGYVTEKLIQSWAAGTVPIYFGALPSIGMFNRQAFVHYSEPFDINKTLATIIALDSLDALYDTTYAEPLLISEPRIDPLLDYLRHAILSIVID